TISDPAENIILGAGVLNGLGNGTGLVSFSDSNIDQLNLSVGDRDDLVKVNSVADFVNIDAGSGNDKVTIAQQLPSAVLPSNHLDGGTGVDTLVNAVPTQPGYFYICGPDHGFFNGVLDFSATENLTGGAGADTFAFYPFTGGSLSGILDGGAGLNALDYSAFVDDILVNLNLGLASAV